MGPCRARHSSIHIFERGTHLIMGAAVTSHALRSWTSAALCEFVTGHSAAAVLGATRNGMAIRYRGGGSRGHGRTQHTKCRPGRAEGRAAGANRALEGRGCVTHGTRGGVTQRGWLPAANLQQGRQDRRDTAEGTKWGREGAMKLEGCAKNVRQTRARRGERGGGLGWGWGEALRAECTGLQTSRLGSKNRNNTAGRDWQCWRGHAWRKGTQGWVHSRRAGSRQAATGGPAMASAACALQIVCARRAVPGAHATVRSCSFHCSLGSYLQEGAQRVG